MESLAGCIDSPSFPRTPRRFCTTLIAAWANFVGAQLKPPAKVGRTPWSAAGPLASLPSLPPCITIPSFLRAPRRFCGAGWQGYPLGPADCQSACRQRAQCQRIARKVCGLLLCRAAGHENRTWPEKPPKKAGCTVENQAQPIENKRKYLGGIFIPLVGRRPRIACPTIDAEMLRDGSETAVS